ncbi:hypothetical protein [Candidatus Protochlamydia sp. W-9]|uniref:hypothetical protein n=1 Tax=Candidatus Protochlamydia sp. W-9 TaxID=1785087 RepID=UPI00096A62A5|nr:hypothetical protein [Candidatus Protochlamydia sp. W-9]
MGTVQSSQPSESLSLDFLYNLIKENDQKVKTINAELTKRVNEVSTELFEAHIETEKLKENNFALDKKIESLNLDNTSLKTDMKKQLQE